MAIEKEKENETETNRKGARGGQKPNGRKDADTRRSRSKRLLVERMIRRIAKQLSQQKARGTVGDLVRLLQLEKEIEEELPKEVRVTWVEPAEEESASET